MAKFITPKMFAVIGMIVKTAKLNADEYEKLALTNTGGDARVVTMEPFDGTPNQDVWFAENQIEEFGLESILWVGNAVNISIEERIAGITGYVDVDGMEHLHGENAPNMAAGTVKMSARNANECSIIALERADVSDRSIDRIEAKRADHADAVAKVAKYHPGRGAVVATDSLLSKLRVKLLTATGGVKAQIEARIAELEAAMAPEHVVVASGKGNKPATEA